MRRYFRSLESLNMCHIETSKATDTGYTLITLVNYEAYQNRQHDEPEPAPTSDAPSVAPSDPASMPHPCPTLNKGNKENKNLADAGASAGAVSKGNKTGTKTRKTDPETDALLQEFASAFQAKLSEPYLIEWGRDRKAMGGLVAIYGAASVRAKLAAFFEHGTRETRERRAWTVPEFRRVFPQLIGMQAMGDL
ncbi:MAG: hypothetical protein ACHQ7N_19590 [Candidatus Methylomirabilales bacterium]